MENEDGGALVFLCYLSGVWPLVANRGKHSETAEKHKDEDLLPHNFLRVFLEFLRDRVSFFLSLSITAVSRKCRSSLCHYQCLPDVPPRLSGGQIQDETSRLLLRNPTLTGQTG